MLKRFAFIAAILAISSLVAGAAELTEAPGGKLNGEAAASLPAKLQAGDMISGPATIKTAAGETLLLSDDGMLEVKESQEEGKELFFVKAGSLRGQIGSGTSIAIPTGWLEAPKGQTVEFYARTMDAARGYVEVRHGTGVVVYEASAGAEGFPSYSFLLTDGQGIEIWSPSQGNVGFMTSQNNPGDVAVSAQVTSVTEIRLLLPKATAGEMVQEDNGAKTLVRSEAGSWKGGEVRGEIYLHGEKTDVAVLGPGTFVRIDNITGKVLSFAEVGFEIIKRAISLTSEFTAVAASNFFGLSN
jgi:hypothetical protein